VHAKRIQNMHYNAQCEQTLAGKTKPGLSLGGRDVLSLNCAYLMMSVAYKIKLLYETGQVKVLSWERVVRERKERGCMWRRERNVVSLEVTSMLMKLKLGIIQIEENMVVRSYQ
jgi:hypothetical protein